MILDVALSWKTLPERDLSRSVIIVADVLRATTVVTEALGHGAIAVRPYHVTRCASAEINSPITFKNGMQP